MPNASTIRAWCAWIHPRAGANCSSSLALGGLLAGVIFLYAWQHFQSVQLGYQMESLKAQQAQLGRTEPQLTLEAAGLQSPARIDKIAKRTGTDGACSGAGPAV